MILPFFLIIASPFKKAVQYRIAREVFLHNRNWKNSTSSRRGKSI